MPVNIQQFKPDQKVQVEIQGQKIFKGIVVSVVEDAINLKGVKQLQDNKEMAISTEDKQIKFPLPMIINIKEDIQVLQDINHFINNPAQQVDVEDIKDSIITMDLNVELQKRFEEKKEKIINQCQIHGEDPQEKLKKLEQVYDGNQGFFDNTDKEPRRQNRAKFHNGDNSKNKDNNYGERQNNYHYKRGNESEQQRGQQRYQRGADENNNNTNENTKNNYNGNKGKRQPYAQNNNSNNQSDGKVQW